MMKRSPLMLIGIAIATAGFAFQAHAAAGKACLDKDVPEQITIHSYTSADGICLRSFSWSPNRTPVRGVVIITHGIRDHALRYQRFAEQLTAAGYVVYAQDLRGHAHSGGARQQFASMSQLVADTNLVVQEAKAKYPGAPLFAFGHSLGGLVTTQYALAHGAELKGVVLSGAALERPKSVGSVAAGAAKVVGAVGPGLKIVKVDDSEFSRDPKVMAELTSDPMVDHGKLPASTASASIKGMAEVRRRMGELKMPFLVMYGTADKVNPIEGSDIFVKGLGSSDKTLKTYPNVYHDMLHEPERDEISADVITWLNAHT